MLPRTPLNDTIGLILSRVLVPLWILSGVAMKLQAGTASNLPSNFVNLAKHLEWGPEAMNAMLYTLIGLEIFAILVMVLIKRLARPMAIFMLASFVVILLAEIARNAESCGCFGGTISIPPWVMLIADALLLLGVLLFRPPAAEGQANIAGTAIALPAALIAGLIASFVIGSALHPQQRDVTPDPTTPATPDDGERSQEIPDESVSTDPTVNPSPKSVRNNWYPQRLASWPGTPWRELEVFQFMPRWPNGLDEGTVYVVFYSRTCTHCENMFWDDLTRPLGAPVIAIEIPASRTTLTASDAWDMPEADPSVTFANLPIGPDWTLMTPPLSLRIEDGVVTCAEEGDHVNCFDIE